MAAQLPQGGKPAHPRVGGENLLVAAVASCVWGSSPRGRGKLISAVADRRPDRLIPAWAGKTPPTDRLEGPRLAHPRVGGENDDARKATERAYGSSPRGRGKPQPRAPGRVQCRLIPAWAGKTPSSRPRSTERRAHPRVGGENAVCFAGALMSRGSSPRGRGKHN